MKRVVVLLSVTLAVAGCATNDSSEAGDSPSASRAAPTRDSPTTSAPADPTTTRPAPVAIVDWERSGLLDVTGELAHVTDVLVTDANRLVVGFYPDGGDAGIAVTDLAGGPWSVETIAGATQLRDLVELPDGAVLATGTAAADSAIVWREEGEGWTAVGRPHLPTPQAANGWDLEVLGDGSVLLATDSLSNDASRENSSVHRSTDGGLTWTSLAPLPGLGVLALTVTDDGVILAATEDSAEHDDADTAGQARVYTSYDGGVSWDAPAELPGANRVYDLTTLGDGTIWAGTGIRGEIVESTDGGRSWQTLTHVPSATRQRGEGADAEEVTLAATRVYRILELADGRIVVGTGNNNGDLFLTADRGRTWEALPETGPNNVVWGLAQSPDGRLWVGTGSRIGDLIVASAG